MKLLMFFLLAYGISNIMVYGSIFEKWRTFWNNLNPEFLGELFKCMLCFPTWVGFFLSGLFQCMGYETPMTMYGVDNVFLSVFLDGCITSGAIWLLHTFQESLERTNQG